MLHPIEVILLIRILGLFIWVIMNLSDCWKGKSKIKLQNENHWLLYKVRHVPRLSKNLISIGQLGDDGCAVNFND